MQLEAGIVVLGHWARGEHGEAYRDAFANFYTGGWEAFGIFGPDPDELLAADLWLTCDVPLVEGVTVLETIGKTLLANDVVEGLAASALRAWRIEAARSAHLIEVSCLATGDRATVDLPDRRADEPVPGSILVGRGIAVDPTRIVLIGRGAVVAPEAEDDFEDLFWQLSFDQPDVPRLWHECGGQLSAAALGWPEDREYTREGEIVRETRVAFDIPDTTAMIRELDAVPEFRRTGQHFWDSETIAWHWRGPRQDSSPAAMPDDLGVVWSLCDEDAEDPPIEATIELNLDDNSVWLFAPAPGRLARCEREFTERFADLLGPRVDQGFDLIEIIPRWKRERWARTAPALARARRLAA